MKTIPEYLNWNLGLGSEENSTIGFNQKLFDFHLHIRTISRVIDKHPWRWTSNIT